MSLQESDGLQVAGNVSTSVLMEKVVLLLLFLAFLTGVLLVLMPFGVGLMFGSIIAIAAWPLRQLMIHWGLSSGVTAGLLLLLVIAIVVVPILLTAPSLAGQLTKLFDLVRAWLDSSPPPPAWLNSIPLAGDLIHRQWIDVLGSGAGSNELMMSYAGSARATIVSAAKGMGESLLQLLLALIIATMFWVQGDALSATIMDVLRRLGGTRLADMALISTNAVRGVFYGVVGTAATQAALMTIGLLLSGVPGAAPLGFVTLLLALSQIGGPLINLVWAGAAYWLYLQGETGFWLWFLIGWGIFVVTIDNVLKPWLIGASITMPLALVILGVFGGFLSFGFLGLFVGPVLIAIAYALLAAWRSTGPE